MGHPEVQPPRVSDSRTVKKLCRAEFVKSENLLSGFIAVLAKADGLQLYTVTCVGSFSCDRRGADSIFTVTCSSDGLAGGKKKMITAPCNWIPDQRLPPRKGEYPSAREMFTCK